MAQQIANELRNGWSSTGFRALRPGASGEWGAIVRARWRRRGVCGEAFDASARLLRERVAAVDGVSSHLRL